MNRDFLSHRDIRYPLNIANSKIAATVTLPLQTYRRAEGMLSLRSSGEAWGAWGWALPLIDHRIYALWVKAPDVRLLCDNQAWAAPPVPWAENNDEAETLLGD